MESCDFKTNVEDLGEEWTKDSMSTHKKKWRKKCMLFKTAFRAAIRLYKTLMKGGKICGISLF